MMQTSSRRARNAWPRSSALESSRGCQPLLCKHEQTLRALVASLPPFVYNAVLLYMLHFLRFLRFHHHKTGLWRRSDRRRRGTLRRDRERDRGTCTCLLFCRRLSHTTVLHLHDEHLHLRLWGRQRPTRTPNMMYNYTLD
ncbi:hypothetical protein DENSPDRAFT_584609 [Dentipellis sp. KUC8613]|nr:hypothetical protein DENSPDRAFT_584609 [Dentipellis sp. KUC8613]